MLNHPAWCGWLGHRWGAWSAPHFKMGRRAIVWTGGGLPDKVEREPLTQLHIQDRTCDRCGLWQAREAKGNG